MSLSDSFHPQNRVAQTAIRRPLKKRYSVGKFDVFAMIGAAVGMVIIGLVLLASFLTAPVGTAVAVCLAVFPLMALFLFFLWLDGYEKEPFRMLMLAFAWGALGATGFSVLVNTLGGAVLGESAAAVLIAPIVEESTKGVFILGLLYWRRGDLDGIVDGIVYAGFIGGGFAFVENILYFTNSWVGIPVEGEVAFDGPIAVTATFIMRGVASPFAHPMFTALIGIGVGIAVLSKNKSMWFIAPFLGWLGAVGLHAFWNGSTFIGGGLVWPLIYIFIQIPLFIGFIVYCIWERRKLQNRLLESLTDAGHKGFFPIRDIAWIVNEENRRYVARQMEQYYGPDGHKLVTEYQNLAVRFGFLHYKIMKGMASHDYVYEGRDLLQEIHNVRSYLPIPL